MTATQNDTPITPLEERLVDLIKLKGPISIADYMTDALGHPHEGYYMRQTPIGADGDFTTAPEISQVFGELIGLWLVEAWQSMGSPESFNLIELGPGRGTLMVDILRAARLRPGFARAAQVWLVETSGLLRLEQQKRLKETEVSPLWADDFGDIPPAPSLIVANEFFDCLPIHQFERVKTGWRERMVGLDESGTRLAFTLDPTPAAPEYNLPAITESEIGDIFEVSPTSLEFTGTICRTLKENGGHALIIDYGHMERGFGDTLQAVKDHAYWPPLLSPGHADITAHVDFEALSKVAIENGINAHGPVTQGRFLDRLGLALRVEALCKGQPEDKANEIRAGATRIAASNAMGEIFKVLSYSSPNLPTPAGLET
ncbi:SAM-dependent methyltransferase [Hyphococcus formosus]|uniref:class I SAM-dependent methyltransferase n=1 Tax=Hyphococcus formosus TaxID=3143534 RepID=UPI00398B1CBB